MEEPDTSLSRGEDDEEHISFAAEKLACHRCRQRKVKCDRGSPCSHCVKAGMQCAYATAPKPRERRQRVMVSTTYDSKLDAISRKIDELSLRMSQLSHEPANSRASQGFDHADSAHLKGQIASTAFGPTPSSSSIVSTPNHEALVDHSANESSRDAYLSNPSKAEYEGESSLFAHAVFATRFLQNAIDNTTNPEVSSEMEAVLEGLRAAVRSGKQQSDALDRLYPRARPIPPGSTTRNLPLPPMDKVFTCLRMARECPQVAMLWLGDFIKPGQFTDYFIKVVSPGPATEADLLIVHCGLFWLFCECSRVVADERTRHDYNEQASVCEANLETMLANLQFHQPTNLDVVYAMGLASLYCLQKNKPSAAWNFISAASHTIQALGLQHNAPIGTEDPEERSQKKNLFWTVYMTEKMLSLRLGRSSTFRDQDITLTRPGVERSHGSFLSELAPGWISMSSIQGRIYDDIYSPGALMQPPHVRTSRAQALASELKAVMQRGEEIHDLYGGDKGHLLGLDYHEIARYSDRVIGLSMLTLIYRSITPETPSSSAFCQECIHAARNTLQEHDRCVSMITKAGGKMVYLEAYINWTITHSPFTPFIIMFCHVIETAEASDLEHMRRFVETLRSTSTSRVYNMCQKQLRLFKALYDVAEKYIEVKSRVRGSVQDCMRWPTARQQQHASVFPGTTSSNFELDPLSSSIIGGTSVTTSSNVGTSHLLGETRSDGMGLEGGPSAIQSTMFGGGDMEMDLSGAELWDWFNKNQSIMRMLEDA